MITYVTPYGWAGILIMIAGELLLFTGNEFIGIWMTPVMWTGYILFVDNVIYGRTGSSLLMVSGKHLPVILVISIVSWLIFEGYNYLLKNWYYIDLPENTPVRYCGYAWSFATIIPGVLITKDFLSSLHLFDKTRSTVFHIPARIQYGVITVSMLACIYPLLYPNEYLFPLVWVGFIFLIDPLVNLMGGNSVIGEIMKGRPALIYRLLAAGLICGLLWEFWNYWAVAKWIYTVPYFPKVKLFEMPVAGYLGFPPFAVECYVLYQFFKVLLEKAGLRLKYC